MQTITETYQKVNDELIKQPEKGIDIKYKLALLKGWGKRSSYILGKYILGYNRFCETQIEWDELTRKKIDFTGRTSYKGLYLFPRETFKTTFWTITGVIRYLINNPTLSILIANEIFNNSKDILREIKGHLEGNNLFIQLYGNWYNKREWNKEYIIIKPKRSSKEPSIMAAGLGSTLTSKHFPVIFCDDIAGKKDRDSETGREQTYKFFNDIWDVLSKDSGSIHVIGTRWHVRDIYYHIQEVLQKELERQNLDPFEIYCKPAAEGKNYQTLLPKSKLDELRTVKIGKDGLDISMYMAQYELEPLNPNTQIFKAFHYYNHNTTEYSMFIQWTDPALSDKSTACYSATIVIGKIANGQYKNRWGVCYASIKQRKPSVLIKDHNRIYIMHRDMYKKDMDVFMEDNGFQILLKDEAVSEALKEDVEVPTIGRSNRENKEARIRGLEPYITQGFILFREDWETAPEGYRLLIEQLRNFPQGQKDAPDALQCAHKQSQSRFYELDNEQTE